MISHYKAIKIKRVYESFSSDDGYRILIDKLWPRGLTKEKAKIDLWCKEIAPSTELRKWYHSNTEENWQEFKKRYIKELTNKKEILAFIYQKAEKSNVTLLFAAKNEEHNHAIVLLDYLKKYGLSGIPADGL